MTVPASLHFNITVISALELGFETLTLKYKNSFCSEILLNVAGTLWLLEHG